MWSVLEMNWFLDDNGEKTLFWRELQKSFSQWCIEKLRLKIVLKNEMSDFPIKKYLNFFKPLQTKKCEMAKGRMVEGMGDVGKI